MSSKKSNAGQPFWQTEPCPLWCTEHHQDHHIVDEREHYSDMLSAIGLTLANAYEYVVDDEVHGQQASLGVYVEQGYREIAPRIVIEPAHKQTGSRYDITVAEAELLGQALLKAAGIAGGVR